VSAPVTGVTLNKTSLALAPGEKFTLEPVFTPANPTNTGVIWTIDQSSTVVTVSDAGLVTAKATGTAKITVTTKDGNKTATCDVTVVRPVTNIEDVPTGTVHPADKYLELSNKYKVVPYNATYQTVVWSVKNGGGTGAVFTGDTLNVSNWGTVTVTATIVNGKGLEDYTKDFDILFRDRIMITSLKIDDITITKGMKTGGVQIDAYHVTPPDADMDLCWDMLYTPADSAIVDFHQKTEVGVDYWEGLKVGTTKVTARFRQFPNIPVTGFTLTVK
jgi:hypothetical protein